ncbi:DUF58 domain-containing protein [Methylosoma difficile]
MSVDPNKNLPPSSLKERLQTHRFFRGELASDAPYRLNQRRIYILPTQRGINFVLMTLLLLLIAFVYNNNLAYMLAFLLASIFFIAILHTFRTLAGLTVQTTRNPPVFLGESAGFGILLDNPSTLPRVSVKIGFDKATPININLNARSHVDLLLTTPSQQRGWQTAGKIVVSSSYPFGFFRAWSPIRFEQKVLVYPKPAAFASAFPETASSELGQGGISKNAPEDFYGLKEYQAGDAIKHIHWKAFAKGLGLYSKQYGGQSNAEICLDYEQALGHSLEERLSCLCRWVIEAEQAGIPYSFRLPGLRLDAALGASHYRQCLEALALF